MATYDVDFSITSVTSETPDCPAENLAEGHKKGWLAMANAGTLTLQETVRVRQAHASTASFDSRPRCAVGRHTRS